ncbi:MAG TPA: hypothetical protein VJR89_32105, partial [Polyangiales bacterium]|nr:hypothetical protein [Polyangiales bacterium]
MSDLLEQATRALRETTAEREPRSGLTRGRILDGAQKRYASRRGGVLRWAIIAAAALATSTALARVVEYWPEIKRAIAPVFGAPEAAPTPVRKRVQRSAAPPAVQAPPAPQLPVEPRT